MLVAALAPSCNDRILNEDETDRDCGGTKCPQCVSGQMCLLNRDCDHVLCTNNTCQREFIVFAIFGCCQYSLKMVISIGPTCFDGLTNAVETDTDCGGEKCPACADNKKCSVNSDCISKDCSSGICLSESISHNCEINFLLSS